MWDKSLEKGLAKLLMR